MRTVIIGAFLCVPVMTSFVSMLHILDLFTLGNQAWMSLILAIAFEMGSVASFLALGVMDKLKKGIVWSIFILLAFLQIVGNIYATFDFVNKKLIEDPQWLQSMQELLSYILFDNTLESSKIIVTLIIAVPISLISLAFLKSLIDYIPSTKEGLKKKKKKKKAPPEEAPVDTEIIHEHEAPQLEIKAAP